jgi:hypothetical protein
VNQEELDTLAEIARLVADRDLAVLSRLRGEAARLKLEADALAASSERSPDTTIAPAVRAGADERWNRWRLQELRRIQSQRARLAAVEAAAKDQARKSFGRQTVLDELSRKSS